MNETRKPRIDVQKLGLWLAIGFFALSIVMVARNCGGMEAIHSDVPVITFAHWQLEDGFREGVDEVIRLYEAEKARQGTPVKVRQIAIPIRGYSQWFLTQLIGGNPADLMELLGSSDVHNRYFVPLSAYLGEPNPWNAGTVLEKYSWQESYADDMLSSLDTAYSEFFGVNIFMYTTRVYVNMELYRAACGADAPLPRTVTEWLESCRKIREYAQKVQQPLIPIGVRGFDKNTLGQLLTDYNCQLNGALADTGSPYGYETIYGELFRQVNAGRLEREKLLAPVRLVAEIGEYFPEGFPAIDLEQTKYLFSSGMVGFFIDGTYNAWSMVHNSPFEVEVIRMPVIDSTHPLGGEACGEVTELGYGVGGRLGITKSSPHFDLALDFLRFLTSYKASRLAMVEHSKWLSPLKEMHYTGLMAKIAPVTDTAYMPVGVPFENGSYSRRIILQELERGIIAKDADVGKSFWNTYCDNRPLILDELSESRYGVWRTLWSMSATASALRFGAPEAADAALLERRGNINLEGMVGRYRTLDAIQLQMTELEKLEKIQ